jgi:integrase
VRRPSDLPAAREPSRCRSGDAVFNLWKRLAARAGLPKGERYGWHSLRRKFASEMKHTPLRDLAHLGGWKSTQTIVTCYQQPDEATQRDALAQRRPLRASGV